MKKIFISLAALIVLAVAGAAIYVSTVNIDTYRPQIAEALSKQSGRVVKLDGPLSLGLTWKGAKLTIRDAAIGNPAWTSRPVMAGIGEFKLGLSLPPLLEHRLVITDLEIKNADIALEVGNIGKPNWELGPKADAGASVNAKDNATENAAKPTPVALHVDKIVITDSQATYRDKDGKESVFKVASMTLADGSGVTLHLVADYNGAPLTVNVETGLKDMLAPTGQANFTADLDYANKSVTAKGYADMEKKSFGISVYEIKAGPTTLGGDLKGSWGGIRTSIQGTLHSPHVDPADFNEQVREGGGGNTAHARPASQRVFSDQPLGLEGLKSIDAALNVNFDEVVIPNGALKNLKATAVLKDGLLTIDPFKAVLGSGVVEGQAKLGAASVPPEVSVSFHAAGIELEDLLRLANAPTFLSGKATLQGNLASSGTSAHELAGNALGVLNVTAAGGNVSGSDAKNISSGLMQLFAPSGSSGLNCLAARFIIKSGIARDNGILVDTSATTVAAKGSLDLGHETIDMSMRAKSKLVNVAGLVPPLHVGGSFSEPRFGIDPTETVQNVAGLLTNGAMNTGIPDIQQEPGQNACLFTLDHPKAAVAPGILPSTLTGKASEQIKNIGGALKGLFGQ
ncbi:MAG: AsmA family protein [Pseudomonadota bacterium]|nr:AsmA family protein [Pseudomonadota bacterium]